MIKFQVEGTYRSDRGHEHGEPKPNKFAFTVCVERSDEIYKATENEIRRIDDKFDSIRTLESKRLPDEVAKKIVTPPSASSKPATEETIK